MAHSLQRDRDERWCCLIEWNVEEVVLPKQLDELYPRITRTENLIHAIDSKLLLSTIRLLGMVCAIASEIHNHEVRGSTGCDCWISEASSYEQGHDVFYWIDIG